ncbi:hypothetical protein PPYR_02712 [Photinus pyralis]|uniref:Major facilitator superfamily (MFS) profile domain-containing protein n=2 Tax=Photinus pyralis TaxID=7054 RepID=A0A5N4A0R8_PHOPY|nr:facilitated trehalose transporter Tret1-like [Photinus pyralis]XP_031332022.1 facilitated trehalose transporter Tret1-like [Photinus pyralis]KAB0790912.1 hypothetical protein PPYR_02712 [Photinus pyralis]
MEDEMRNAPSHNFKAYLPQIYATLVICFVYMSVGVGVVYSAVLVPQLKDGVHALHVTDTEQLWIVNCISLVIPLLSVLTGLVTDKCGRLCVLKLTVVPHVVGWVTIALAKTSAIVMVGRVITGLSIAFQMGPCFVYISEISTPKIRGALLAMPVVFFGIGSLLTNLNGYLASWRMVAWFSCSYGVVANSLLYTLPNSPSWLVSRNHIDEAKKSLTWLNKYLTNDPIQLEQLVEHEVSKMGNEQEHNKATNTLQMVCLPIVYKPLIILTMVLLFQQFSGVNVLLMNTVIFFDKIGTKLDPYLASNYLAIVRLGMTVLSVWLMKKYGRRPLLMISFFGMAVSMGISGLYTKWIADGVTEYLQVPLYMLVIYTISTTCVMSIPFSLCGEIFPLRVRGIASNTALGLLFVFSFASVSSYQGMLTALGGLHNLQYFYSVMASAGVAFTFLFVPETLNKRLSEIEPFFWTHTLAITKQQKTPTSSMSV